MEFIKFDVTQDLVEYIENDKFIKVFKLIRNDKSEIDYDHIFKIIQKNDDVFWFMSLCNYFEKTTWVKAYLTLLDKSSELYKIVEVMWNELKTNEQLKYMLKYDKLRDYAKTLDVSTFETEVLPEMIIDLNNDVGEITKTICEANENCMRKLLKYIIKEFPLEAVNIILNLIK